MLVPDDCLLRLRDVGIRFGDVVAAERVSLDIPRGATLGLVGESGSGKSTLARAIVGLVPVLRGRILLDGEDLARRRRGARRRLGRRVQIVFQDPDTALDPRMTAGQTLVEAATAFTRLAVHEREQRTAELLELVGLDPALAAKLPRELSGGQRQRVAIARALAVEPDLVIADEITSALDVSVQASVLNMIRRVQAERGLSMLFIGHNLAAVRYVSDVIAVMRQGEIVEVAPADELIASPRHPYTRSLLASVPTLRRDLPDPSRAT
ncbi:ATP-binding cassette domain-containing protein [Nonomuraea sp. NPDC050536]|uniref:ATP-binding cassette domain-containing protein n=1 Tax=Nonomuraea sp. NPDC050536 TaxID=3364366 RepID=UPI0037C5C8B3